MKDFILEACVDSVESACAAANGGATRLELCGNLLIGGTTPSQFLFEQVQRECSIPIHVLIRPRFGDFCYSDWEFDVIRQEVALFRRLGANGVVIGVLMPDGTLDEPRMKILMEEAQGMSVTLHRAFDVCADPWQALETAKRLGINTILTSGQADTCLHGIHLLAQLHEKAEHQIDILAGAGISAEAIEVLRPATGISSYHMSGKIVRDSSMQYRKPGVNMGLPSFSEYELWQTDEQKIAHARKVLEQLD
ncbi:MAG: copper homeostasis protein CutC [Massiliimalia sp.]|jgi:copper homeostasis protein